MAPLYKTALLVVAALFLAGCQHEKDNLTDYIASVKAKQVVDIEPMPVMKAGEKFSYSAGDLRNPFVSTVIDIPVEEEIKTVVDNGIHLDRTRLKEVLESYELSSLQLVGTLEKENVWALVRDPDGVIHKVKEGDYMGKDNGQILTVTDTEVTLNEIVPDGEGGYIERDTSLSVAGEN